MAGLSDLTQTTGTSTTSLPGWYDTAQQNLVNSATSAANSAPQLGQTVAQGAINTLQGPNNPFTAATNTLGSIATGAANPWITDASGNVTPNTNTAMGGLFAAQQNEFNQLLPTTLAPSNASAIGSGNFGSLRGQTAVDTTAANALSQLRAQQMQAALQNQQTGVTAAANQGNVAQQGITNAMNVGQEQMTAPFTSTANLGNILASISAPQTVSTTQNPSTLQNLTGLGSVASGGLNALFSNTTTDAKGNKITTPGILSNLGSLGTSISNLFGGSTPTTPTGGNDSTGPVGGGAVDTTTGPINPGGSSPIDTTNLVLDANGDLVPAQP
jgi:hypothetical protein